MRRRILDRMKFYDPCPPIQSSDIDELNRKLNSTLPEDYVNFLLTQNGGQPEYEAFKNEETGNTLFLDNFLGIDPSNSSSDIYTTYAMLSGQIPTGFLPIVDDGVGNVVCLGLSDKHKGKIYVWWHDVSPDKIGTSGLKNLDFVCDSFQDLLDGMVDE
jgi:cell wall assembly regulator SMI1